MRDLHESDDLRILDYNGERAFRLFRLAELGPRCCTSRSEGADTRKDAEPRGLLFPLASSRGGGVRSRSASCVSSGESWRP